MINKNINYKNLVKLILIFILFYSSKLIRYIPIKLLNIDIKNMSTIMNILLSIFSSLCVLIVLLIIYREDLIKDIKNMKNNFFKVMDTSLKYYLFGIFGMIITNLLITFIFKGTGSNNEKLVQNMINASPSLMFISAGLIGPIVEELVFRKPYKDTFKDKWTFVIISGFVFGSMHVITSATNNIGLLYLIPYASLGMSFAYMDYKEDNIFPSIIMHILHNSILVILSSL